MHRQEVVPVKVNTERSEWCNAGDQSRQIKPQTVKANSLWHISYIFLCLCMLASCTKHWAQCGGQRGMAAVQMPAALVHIHSTALSRATVHRQAHTNIHKLTHAHSSLGSRERGKKTVNHTIFPTNVWMLYKKKKSDVKNDFLHKKKKVPWGCFKSKLSYLK